MTYIDPAEAARLAHHFASGPAREREMLRIAEDLLAKRSKVTGLSPKTLLNQIVPDEPETKPTKQQAFDSDIASQLIARLHSRDQTGGGSGAPG